jgi:hypothetical protein
MIKVSADKKVFLAESIDFEDNYIEICGATLYDGDLECSMIARKKLDNLSEISDLKYSNGTNVHEVPFTPQEELEIVAIDAKLEYISTNEEALLSNIVLTECYSGKD